MSKKGIDKAIYVLTILQQAKEGLIRMGSLQADTKSGQQDILLGQLMEKAKSSIADDFAKIVD